MYDWLVIIIDVVAIFSINNVVFVFIFSTLAWTKIRGFPTLNDLKIDSLYEMRPYLLSFVFTWEVPSRWWVLLFFGSYKCKDVLPPYKGEVQPLCNIIALMFINFAGRRLMIKTDKRMRL